MLQEILCFFININWWIIIASSLIICLINSGCFDFIRLFLLEKRIALLLMKVDYRILLVSYDHIFAKTSWERKWLRYYDLCWKILGASINTLLFTRLRYCITCVSKWRPLPMCYIFFSKLIISQKVSTYLTNKVIFLL